jgi:hypothetical protein
LQNADFNGFSASLVGLIPACRGGADKIKPELHEPEKGAKRLFCESFE